MARQCVRIALGCADRPKPEGFIVWGTIGKPSEGWEQVTALGDDPLLPLRATERYAALSTAA